MQKHYTVGDFMKEARAKALQSVATFLGLLVYAFMLVWSGLHNYNLLSAGVPEDLRFFGIAAFVILELNAIALPLYIHTSTQTDLQHWVAVFFYVLDLGLLLFNSIVDYALVANTDLLVRFPWLQTYLNVVAPGSPILAGLAWAVIPMLHLSHKWRRAMTELRSATQEALMQRIAEVAQSAEVEDLVRDAAREMALRVVRQTLALPVPHALPGPAPSPSPNGHKPNGHQPETAEGNPTKPPVAAARPEPSPSPKK